MYLAPLKKITIAACLLLYAFVLSAQDRVVLQGFYWDANPNGHWYDTLASHAKFLGDIGVDGVWFPPPSKGMGGGFDVGYTPYDYYDLGEYDSRGGDVTSGTGAYTRTRYGTRAQLEHAIQSLHRHGIEAYADAVLNHRSGGSLEPNIHGQWFSTSPDHGSMYGQNDSTYTAFPLTNGSGRIAWPVGEGNERFFPNSTNNPFNTGDFYATNQLGNLNNGDGYFGLYINSFAYDVALHNGAGQTLPMGDSLMVWGDWLIDEIGFDGFRFDFVKGIHPDYLKAFVDHGSKRGKYIVGELYDGSIGRLQNWSFLHNVNRAAGSAPMRVFDFNLRFTYKSWSDNTAGFDIRTLQGAGLIENGEPWDRVSHFVDNHDFDRLNYQGVVPNGFNDSHQPVINQKILMYAHMMALPGEAYIWYKDMYWYGLKNDIAKLAMAREQYFSGSYQVLTETGNPFFPGNATNDAPHLMAIQRGGSNGNPGAIVVINKHPSWDLDVWVDSQFANQTLVDISGNQPESLAVQSDGRVLIKSKANSYHIFVPAGEAMLSVPSEQSALIQSQSNGLWSSPATWVGGVVPGAANEVDIQHDVTLDQDATVLSLRVELGHSLNWETNSQHTLSIAANGSFSAAGTVQPAEGTLLFLGAGSINGNPDLHHVHVPAGVHISSGATIHGTLTIASGGYMAKRAAGSGLTSNSEIPNFAAGSTLRYEGTFSFGANDNFAGGWGLQGAKSPTHLQLGPNAQVTISTNERRLNGNLHIEAGGELVTNGLLTLGPDATITSFDGITGTINFEHELTGRAGWRLLSAPANTLLSDFLAPIWTQGVTQGGDASTGSPNVFLWDRTTDQWQAATDLDVTLAQGTGVLVYVFADDDSNGPNSASWPKTLQVQGSAASSGVAPAVSSVPNGWSLVGNPYLATIDLDQQNRTDLTQVAYVWDPNAGASGQWKSWNGTIGDLTDGLVGPFQGFFVQNTAAPSSPSFSFVQKTTENRLFMGKSPAESLSLRFALKVGEYESSTWLSFDPYAEEGIDAFDAIKWNSFSRDYAELATLYEGQRLDIQHVPLQDKQPTEIELFIDAQGQAAQYATGQLSLTQSNLPEGWTLTLLDQRTQQESPISTGESLVIEGNWTNTTNKLATEALKPQRWSNTQKSQSSFVLRITPPTLTSLEEDLPTTLSLKQNYPNPFNPSTTIGFDLPRSSRVQLLVFDALGRQVAQLSDQIYAAGSHSVVWNASAFNSGLYFYRLTVDGQTITRPMTLIK